MGPKESAIKTINVKSLFCNNGPTINVEFRAVM